MKCRRNSLQFKLKTIQPEVIAIGQNGNMYVLTIIYGHLFFNFATFFQVFSYFKGKPINQVTLTCNLGSSIGASLRSFFDEFLFLILKCALEI